MPLWKKRKDIWTQEGTDRMMQPQDCGPVSAHDVARKEVRQMLIPARVVTIPGLWRCQVDTAAPEVEGDNAPVASPGNT